MHVKVKITRCTLWLLVIVWAVVIFCFSAQSATQSSDLSGGFIRRIIEFFYPGFNLLEQLHQAQIVQGFQFLVRKIAHFSEYAILGFLIMSAFMTHKISTKQRRRYSVWIGSFYALTDEFHQIFVPGRAMRLYDIAIDVLGVIVGVVIAFLLGLLIHKFLFRRK
ncbi:MAG: VanZ family protein [Oscillospiraceae bacterium]|nr:VanZ family protein [Oscillospiraceae bacterium]